MDPDLKLVRSAEHPAVDAVARSFVWQTAPANLSAKIQELPVLSLALAELLAEPGRRGVPREWRAEELSERLRLSLAELAQALEPLVNLGLLHICKVVAGEAYHYAWSLQPRLWLGPSTEYDTLLSALTERVSRSGPLGLRHRRSPLAERLERRLVAA